MRNLESLPDGQALVLKGKDRIEVAGPASAVQYSDLGGVWPSDVDSVRIVKYFHDISLLNTYLEPDLEHLGQKEAGISQCSHLLEPCAR